jgi:hypothetical protein
MSSSEFFINPGRFETLRTPFAAAATTAGPIFVDVGANVTEANITREGAKIPNVILDADVIGSIIDIAPRPAYKVLQQSVEAGRAIERGTIVSLTMGEVFGLPIGIVGGVLAELSTLTIGELYTPVVGSNPEVKRILGRKTTVEELNDAEKSTLVAALGQGGITVDPNDNEAFSGAFTGLQTLHLFGA